MKDQKSYFMDRNWLINHIECFAEVGEDNFSLLIISIYTNSNKFVSVAFPFIMPCWKLESGAEIENVIWLVTVALKSLGVADIFTIPRYLVSER